MNAPSDNELRHWLQSTRTIAVVGISDDPSKPSHYVSAYMQEHGYTIVPVNPKLALRGQKVLGQTCYAHLQDIPKELGGIDLVNCFRKTADILPIAQDALAVAAKGLWQQKGIDNTQASDLARAAGMWTVSNRCLMVDHRRLLG